MNRANKDCSGKRIAIVTFGCQMNVRDSEVIAGLLNAMGYGLATGYGDADVIIFNTCSVRQHAEDKVWSEIGRIGKQSPVTSRTGGRRQETQKNRAIIGLVGCMAQNYKEAIFQRSQQVDFVVGPQDLAKIPEIINNLLKKGHSPKNYNKKGALPFGDSSFYERKIWETDGEARPEEIYHTGFYEDAGHAYVVISEGCSNFCSYCVVPYVRGALRHRHHEDILREIEEAAAGGITRVTLLGQNVNSYKGSADSNKLSAIRYPPNANEIDFIKLLEMVNQIKGLKEFSFMTSHPKDTSIELFKAMAGLGKLKKCLHLPVQSGSDRVLGLMNRGYGKKYYLELAQSYRKIVKGGELTTDIIVGFPSETKEDFQETYDLVKEAGFNAAFIFKYSPRPHTKAQGMADDVAREEKERRHGLILGLQKRISNEIKKSGV